MLQALSTFSISNAVPIAHCSFFLSPSTFFFLPFFPSYNLCCQGFAG